MRTTLRIAALFVLLVAVAFWFFGGANPGWTKTSVAHFVKDPVTGLEAPVYEDRFVPGLDFLAAGFAAAGVTAAVSFAFRARQ